MKVKIIGNPISQYGSFSDGQILTEKTVPAPYLEHLVDVGCAVDLDQQTKMDNDYEVKKSPPSSPLSPPGKVSKKKTSSTRKKKQQS